MEATGLKCNGCGSSNVVFDPKRRILVCNQCGKEEYYSRATLNSNGKVLLSKDNAMQFFAEGKFDSARHYALEILNISQDNAPALFIIAYYDDFVERKDYAVKQFFTKIRDISLEYNEIRELIILFENAIYNMSDYEKEMLELIALNMQSSEDIKELSEFADKICPYYILKRTSINYFTNGMYEIYKEYAEHCDIPKTCFALMKSIKQNPDSPYCNNTFYLKSKTEYFYNNYVIPIGEIISSMSNGEFKQKFINSYKKLKEEYISDEKK